jgi:hypothetical protein
MVLGGDGTLMLYKYQYPDQRTVKARARGPGFRVLGEGFRILGQGFRILGVGFRILGARVQGL